MAEYTANALQAVSANQNVLFSDVAVRGNCSIYHRPGSGIFTLRGITRQQCYARYHIEFSGNISIPTGGTVEPISLAIAVNGEAIPTSSMIFTPAAVDQFGNVSSFVTVDVPAGCCVQASIKNTSTQTINVQNANLSVERRA